MVNIWIDVVPVFRRVISAVSRMVTNKICAIFHQRVHTTLVVNLQLSFLDNQDVDIEREGGVGGVQLVVISLAHDECLQVGPVCHTRQLIPGKHGTIYAVLRYDVVACGVDCDVGAGGYQDVGVSVVCVPNCLRHVKVLPIPAITSIICHHAHVPAIFLTCIDRS